MLDLGSGYGAIACVLAASAPKSMVYAVDVNSRALDLVRRNAEEVGVADRVIAAHPDEVPADVTFDQIWSNPPIRVGKTELHGMLDRWLPRLAPPAGPGGPAGPAGPGAPGDPRDSGGTAWLVVARHLGGDSLHRWLTEAGWSVERHASQKGYRVLRVRHAP